MFTVVGFKGGKAVYSIRIKSKALAYSLAWEDAREARCESTEVRTVQGVDRYTSQGAGNRPEWDGWDYAPFWARALAYADGMAVPAALTALSLACAALAPAMTAVALLGIALARFGFNR